MSSLNIYSQLANRIDGMPRDTPNHPPEDYWVKILSLMVTEREADVACMCTQEYMTVEQIAEKEGVKAEDIKDDLIGAANGGVLVWVVRDGVDYFKLHGWYPGIGETAPLIKGEKGLEIAKLFGEMSTLVTGQYGPEGRAAIPFGRGPMRVIPIERAVKSDQQIASYENLKTYLDQYNTFSLADCACRKMEAANGNPCEHPIENMCIEVGEMAEYYVRTGRGIPATREEVDEVLKKAERLGMVHHYFNNEGAGKSSLICNCCGCSCMGMKTENWFRVPDYDRSNFVAQVNPENCVACGACAEICNMNAIRLGTTFCSVESQTPVTERIPSENRWTEAEMNPDWNKKIMVRDKGTSPCKTQCPAHISIQGYIRKAAQGKYDEALKVIKRDNPFPAVCGRICPHSCEDECTRARVDEAMAIDDIKKFIADKELEAENRYIPEVYEHFEEKVAVIGAGPAGMTAAYYLAVEGYPVTVFERNPAPGGMLRFGIPPFRLEKNIIDAEIDVLRELGVEFRCGVNVGKDVTIAQLREQGYKAFYVAIGAQQARKLGVEGENYKGVLSGIEFLRSVNTGKAERIEGDTVVIGGGNVAVDVARAAMRLGNRNVKMVCLEKDEEMPTVPDEKDEAIAEGIDICNSWGPVRILGQDGKVIGVEFRRCLSVMNESGRFAPVFDDNDTMVIPCSNVYLAIGQFISWDGLLDGTKAETPNGRVVPTEDITYQTPEEDIFAGGDCATGPKFTIDAIATGKSGAISIHRYLRKRSLTMRREREYKPFEKDAADYSGYDKMPRQRPRHATASKALETMSDTRTTFTEEQLKKEAERCLGCGVSVVDPYMCVGCGLCATKCEFDAVKLVKLEKTVDSAETPQQYMTDLMTYIMSREQKLAAKEAGK